MKDTIFQWYRKTKLFFIQVKNVYILRTPISKKGQEAYAYYSRIVIDPETQPETYAEILLERELEQFDCDRHQAALMLVVDLARHYPPKLFKSVAWKFY